MQGELRPWLHAYRRIVEISVVVGAIEICPPKIMNFIFAKQSFNSIYVIAVGSGCIWASTINAEYKTLKQGQARLTVGCQITDIVKVQTD